MFLRTGDKELDEIPTYIVFSMIALFFCFFPGGIAVYYSLRVIDDKKKGNAFAARYHSGSAKLLVIIFYALGLTLIAVKLFDR